MYLVGDLNIRLDYADDVHECGTAGRSSQRLRAQHQLGGMIDVVATHRDLTAPDVKVVDIGLSGHHLLHIQGSCRPRSADQSQSTLSAYLDEVSEWMWSNHLQQNTAKRDGVRPHVGRTICHLLLFVSESTV